MKMISYLLYFRIIFLATIFGIFNGCTKNLTQQNLIYYNNFENGELKNIELFDFYGPINISKIEDFNGSKALGPFNNSEIRLELDNVPEHNAITVEFTLYIHDKWDGDLINSSVNIPDLWNMEIDNNSVLITTFSNNPANKQSYPNFYHSGNNYPAKGNSLDSSLIGLCALKGIAGGSSSYHIVKTFAHSKEKFTLQCNDALQPFNSLCLKSWAIDDLKITAITY
jgi:hypothetical protein